MEYKHNSPLNLPEGSIIDCNWCRMKIRPNGVKQHKRNSPIALQFTCYAGAISSWGKHKPFPSTSSHPMPCLKILASSTETCHIGRAHKSHIHVAKWPVALL